MTAYFHVLKVEALAISLEPSLRLPAAHSSCQLAGYQMFVWHRFQSLLQNRMHRKMQGRRLRKPKNCQKSGWKKDFIMELVGEVITREEPDDYLIQCKSKVGLLMPQSMGMRPDS
ncbi:hypothetical protein CAEBREN_07514 [Caenorhabditis brenneri]|uniref:Uncharacterized protein n=1 Tax=Caenorhabditis brenneri TaxID=135651 RepID=G0N1N3_CAEBE|nr:hypothetical protein CAEBREN_07514 [Caenorhabditis brenneri]